MFFQDKELAVRPGLLLFIFTVLLALAVTRARLSSWEQAYPPGEYSFAGVIRDAGCLRPEGSGGRVLQIIRLDDGSQAAFRMKDPGRRGDRVEGKAFFRPGEGSRNPGGFSERAWLWGQGAGLTGSIISARILPKESLLLSLLRLPDRFRSLIRTDLADLWASGGGPLLLSLAAGDTRLLGEKESYFLRTAGLSHLTSVSGTHLLFLLLPVRRGMKDLGLSRRWQILLSLPVTLIPGLVSGWKSGVSRATIMSLAAQLDQPLLRRRDLFNSLFLTGTLMLAGQPFALYDSSFWMSMTAAAAVSSVSAELPSAFGLRRQEKWLLRLKSALLIPAWAQLALLPYLAARESGIHLLSPLINMLALPLAALMTASAYAVLAFGLLLQPWPAAAKLLNQAMGALFAPPAGLLMGMAEASSKIRWAFFPLKNCLILLPILAFLLLYRYGGKLIPRLHVKWASALSLVLLLLLSFFLLRPGSDLLLFLDVGQGDASLVRWSRGPVLLVDGGDRGQGFRTVIPAARALGISRIDLAIVTHAHSDHAAGVLELMQAGLIDGLCLPGTGEALPLNMGKEEDMTEQLLELARSDKIPVRFLEGGDVIRLGDACLEVLHPSKGVRGDLNNLSLVMKLTTGEVTVLLTGDLEGEGERALLASGAEPGARILHVGHHGSRNASTEAFLGAVSPEAALISVAAGNLYGHPHPEVLDRLEAGGIAVFRTDESGALFLKIKDGKGRINPWIKETRKEP